MTGFCTDCGTDLDADGARRCTCRPRSRLADVAIAAARASDGDSPQSFRAALRAAALVFRPIARKDKPS